MHSRASATAACAPDRRLRPHVRVDGDVALAGPDARVRDRHGDGRAWTRSRVERGPVSRSSFLLISHELASCPQLLPVHRQERRARPLSFLRPDPEPANVHDRHPAQPRRDGRRLLRRYSIAFSFCALNILLLPTCLRSNIAIFTLRYTSWPYTAHASPRPCLARLMHGDVGKAQDRHRPARCTNAHLLAVVRIRR
jgi:hypothetical protein